MALVDSIIGAESGGDPNARNPNSLIASVIKKNLLGARIVKLFFTRGPSAVFWRIIAVTVDPIKRMALRRLFAHISQEIFKAILPSFTNLNSSGPVPFVGDVFLVGAASNHAHPRMIFGRGLSAARNRNGPTVRRVGSFGGFNFPATATHCVARAKVWDRYIDRVSAIAHARISADFGSSICPNLWGRFANGYKPSEPFAGAIYGGCH